MNVDDFKPFPVGRFGGQVDYQDSTKVINGCALLAQMVRFLPDQVGTCFGTVDTMKREMPYEEVTGINVLNVLGVLNPGQIPVLFGDAGSLLEESPAGSGALIPLTPPFPLPINARMQSCDAENAMSMAFSDGIKGLVPPLRLNGVTGILAPAQNPIGGLWSKDLIYQLGDLVRSADGRWWRCAISADGYGDSVGPAWPAFNGFFSGTPYNRVGAEDVVGRSQWYEWTPACVQYIPPPDVTGASAAHNPGGGTIPSGKDLYVKFTYYIPQTGESQRSLAVVFAGTSANDAVSVNFGAGDACGPFMPQWLAEINLHPELFCPLYMNVWMADVTTGANPPADSAYFLAATLVPPNDSVTISSLTPVTVTATGVVSATVNSGGVVSKIPTISFFGGGGFGARGRVIASPVFNDSGTLIGWEVDGITIISPGQGYSSTTAIVFSPPGPTATANLGPVQVGATFPQGCSIAWVNPNAPTSFIGSFGQRYMLVTRFNQNGSPAPVDPKSPISVNLIGQLQLPIVTILRDSSGNVSCTVGDVTIGWQIGSQIIVAGCTGDATFNGTFVLTDVQPTLSPQGILTWKDPAHSGSASNDETGNITLPAGPPPVVFLPPGGTNDLEDVAAFTETNGAQPNVASQAGPFFYVSEAVPAVPYSSAITAMEGAKALAFSGVTLTRDAGGFVTAPIGNIAGIEVGDLVTVLAATDASFNGQFSLQGVMPGTGTAGTLTWAQGDINATTTTANLEIQIGEQSSLQITVEDASGFSAGDVCIPLGVPVAFGGQVTIASINGNVITAASLATGKAAITAGAVLELLQNLPTTSAALPQTILSIARDNAGNVQAAVGNVGGYAAGQFVSVSGVPTADFDGSFEIVGVQVNQDGVTGTLSWQQPGLGKESDTSGNGTIAGSSDFIANFQDELLVAEQDNEVTAQLTMSPPPASADVYFVPSLRKFVYTRGTDSVFVFSETDDAENIDLGDGTLSVDDNSMSLAICVREARTGEIIAMKVDGGYAINPSDLPPTEWPCPTRWTQHGPPCAAAVGKGKDFLIFPSFWSEAGCYLYMNGTLDWITKEFQKVWDRVTRDAINTIWTIVDEQEKEVQIGLPLDGALTPSHIVVGSYIEGWGPQEVLNRYGKLITARSAIRWSIRPRATRTAAVVQRTLVSPQTSFSVAYPFVSISRTGGVVTAVFAGSPPPVITPGGLIRVLMIGFGGSSFNGFHFTTIASGANSLSWLQLVANRTFRITNWSWVNGLMAGTGTILIPGTVPPGITPGVVKLFVRGTGSLLDGQIFAITNVVQGVGNYAISFALGIVFPTDQASGLGGAGEFLVSPPDASAAAGNVFLSTIVPQPTTDPRVQSRQVLIAPSGPDPFQSVNIVSADRRTGMRGDGSVGGVITLRFVGPLDGDVALVIVSGMSDPSFNGTYDTPCTAAWGADGVHSILQFETSGPTSVAYGGDLWSTESCLRVVMQDPTRLDDNGVGLDSKYTPAFAQAGGMTVIRWGAYSIQVGGIGKVLLTPQNEDPTVVFDPDEVFIDTVKATKVQGGLRVPDNEYLTLGVSNGGAAGQGFVLQDLTLYGVPIFTGRRV